MVEVDNDGTVTALKKGSAVIVAASKAAPELTKEFTIRVTENNFKTNIPEFVAVNGSWIIDDETLSVSNGGQNDYYMSAEAIEGDYVLETDIRYTRGLVNLFLASENVDPHEGVGAYTIQFGYDSNVRLFPFGREDFTRGTMDSPINDGAYHHVKVIREGQTLLVYVDDVKCLEHTFEETEAFFANGHVGIGLWDGALDVQNFFVHQLKEEPEVIASGWSGYTTWKLTEDGVLTVSPTEERWGGKCNMKNYWKVNGELTLPWGAYAEQITTVVIEEGVNAVGQMAFYELPNLTTVLLPEAVEEIRSYAFKNCAALTGINLENVEYIREGAFYGCSALEDVSFREGAVIEDWAFSKTAVVLP